MIAIVLVRWRRDVPLLAVTVGCIAIAVALFSTWTRPYDSYWFMTLTTSMALTYALAVHALPWPRVTQAVGVALLGSRSLAEQAPVLRDIRITFVVHPSMDKYFLYTILDGRIDRAAPHTAFIEPDGRVRIE